LSITATKQQLGNQSSQKVEVVRKNNQKTVTAQVVRFSPYQWPPNLKGESQEVGYAT
jgi:antitoxin component of MazEF toxin-antitoxin module